ncbi:hypothetical protein QQF64_005499 [Cirrhinus molitorella]|uniref:Glycine N-acyltransferase-like protein n=1 Tax=Cirrhinus molitorella TaxID=172907 RepID=A0ABR3MCE2_9TELE
MKILNSDELKIAETTLYAHLPKSIKAYGFVFAMNRGKPHTLEVLVDTWPAFTTIIVRPDPNNNRTMDFRKKVTLYSTDEEVLKRMLTVENAIDWSTYFLIGGCDLCHSPMLKEIAASRGISMKGYSLVHLMTLTEPSHLPELITSRDIQLLWDASFCLSSLHFQVALTLESNDFQLLLSGRLTGWTVWSKTYFTSF